MLFSNHDIQYNPYFPLPKFRVVFLIIIMMN